MPYVNIQMVDDGKTVAQKQQLIDGVTKVLSEVLGNPPESVWIVIDEVPLTNWGIGGRSVAVRRTAAAEQATGS